MGYRSEKKSQDKTLKWLRLGVVVGTCILFAVLCVFSAFVPVESWKYYWNLPSVSSRKVGELRIHYLDVENGGCALVELPDGKNVIVGGGADDGEARKNTFRFLNALKIKTVDALIVPNTSRNGVGVLRELAAFYNVKSAYVTEMDSNNTEYASFLTELQRKGVPIYEASEGVLFSEIGGYVLRVLFPLRAGDSTLGTVLMLSYMGVDVLLGDGYGQDVLDVLQVEKDLGLWEKWGVSLEKFDVVQAPINIDPKDLTDFVIDFSSNTVIFSCRGGEGYAPSNEALNALSAIGSRAYRTDENGYITVSIDESGYNVTTEKE
jgi:beta-lactamase superfamily II metal-dependent hydrolase